MQNTYEYFIKRIWNSISLGEYEMCSSTLSLSNKNVYIPCKLKWNHQKCTKLSEEMVSANFASYVHRLLLVTVYGITHGHSIRGR